MRPGLRPGLRPAVLGTVNALSDMEKPRSLRLKSSVDEVEAEADADEDEPAADSEADTAGLGAGQSAADADSCASFCCREILSVMLSGELRSDS